MVRIPSFLARVRTPASDFQFWLFQPLLSVIIWFLKINDVIIIYIICFRYSEYKKIGFKLMFLINNVFERKKPWLRAVKSFVFVWANFWEMLRLCLYYLSGSILIEPSRYLNVYLSDLIDVGHNLTLTVMHQVHVYVLIFFFYFAINDIHRHNCRHLDPMVHM